MKGKRILKALFALGMLSAVTVGFFCAPYGSPSSGDRALLGWILDPAVRIQPAASWTFLVVLLLTPLLGRFFCETCCPLGILQSLVNRIFHPRRHVRRVCTRLPVTKGQWIVRLAILLVFVALVGLGFGALAWSLTPYSIYGKALTLLAPGVVLFVAILASAPFGQGRLWCNWVCPVGTLFTLLSKKSVCAHKVGPGCSNCRKCFGGASTQTPLSQTPQHPDALTRREAIQGVAVLAAVEAAEKTVDGGYAPVSLPGLPARERPVLPPGAVDVSAFNVKCVACGRCIEACRGGCLKASVSLRRLGQPEMDFRKGPCLSGCGYACAAACPTGALVYPGDLPHKDVHVGYAVWEKDLCIRTTDGVPCTACSRKCPVGAIHIVEGFPVVDKDACIGCGACEHVCPSRPMPAIVVEGLERQRVVRPMPREQ